MYADSSPNDTDPDPLIGQIIDGRFQIVSRIARGGMSRIYKAVQMPLGRVVAVKLVDASSPGGSDPEMRARFIREAATCARLHHPNTVTVHDYGTIEATGTLFMVLEFVDGRNLHQEIRAVGPINPPRAVRIACEVARALHEAHRLGIIHRDLKSSNVMLTQRVEGEAVKLVDFGIAKITQSGAEEISLGNTVLGSPGYMPPEQISGGVVDARSDVYSLGAVMFEMLTGHPPFRRETNLQTLVAHLQEDAPSVRDDCPVALPDTLVAVVDACLSRRAGDRPNGASALLQELRQVLNESYGTGFDLPVPSSTWARSDPGTIDRTPMPVEAPPQPRMVLVLSLALFASVLALVAVGTAGVAVWASLERLNMPVAAPVASVLTLVSVPVGASVWEEGEVLGTTPLHITVEPGGPTRHFLLRHEGYEDFSLTRDPGAEDVQIVTELRPARSAPTSQPGARGINVGDPLP